MKPNDEITFRDLVDQFMAGTIRERIYAVVFLVSMVLSVILLIGIGVELWPQSDPSPWLSPDEYEWLYIQAKISAGTIDAPSIYEQLCEAFGCD